jgi:hypothetical protein
MHRFIFGLQALILAIVVISCCDPKPRNSYPTVIDSSYSYLTVKDAFTYASGAVDSLYYPVYSVDIKNTGSEADSFKLTIDPQNIYSVLTVTQFVGAGETKTFKTYGPLPSNIDDSAKHRYYGFVYYDPDSLDLRISRPHVTISYGSSIDGPESCGTQPITETVNIDSLIKKK